MKFAFRIALRYLFSSKKNNVINIITSISMVGIAVGAFALIIILSAFNGLEKLVESLYNSFDPDIKIELAEGKFFDSSKIDLEKLNAVESVEFVSQSLEETVLLKFKDKQSVAVLKGVETSFIEMSGIDSMMIDGELSLKKGNNHQLIFGYGVASNLSVYADNVFEPVWVYFPNKLDNMSLQIEQAFKKKAAMPAGVFSINPDFDNKYTLADIEFVRELLGENRTTSIDVGLKEQSDFESTKAEIKSIVGDEFTVKTKYELNEIIYKTNNTEKWVTFFILAFVIVIAAFNLLGSITMLLIEKKDDMQILSGMGATSKTIRAIFMLEGFLVTLIGSIIGLTLGLLVCIIHQHFGIIRLDNVVAEFYPIRVIWTDIVFVLMTTMLIGLLATTAPISLSSLYKKNREEIHSILYFIANYFLVYDKFFTKVIVV